MKKDFLLQYKDELLSKVTELIDSGKSRKICRIDNFYKSIVDEIMTSNVDISLCRETFYLPVHIASVYLREENIYNHVLFIFNLHTSEVLILLTNSQTPELNKSETTEMFNKLSQKDKQNLKQFFKTFNQNKIDFDLLLNCTTEISKSLDVLEFKLKQIWIDDLKKFLNIISAKEMLTLFGYYLYTYIYCKNITRNKYRSIINITYNPKNTNTDEIKAVYSLLHRIITSEKSLSSKNVLTSDDIITKENALHNFKNATDNLIIINYSEPSRKKPIGNILDIYSTLEKQKKHIGSKKYHQGLNRNMIIISKKHIDKKGIIPVAFDNFNASNHVDTKKVCAIFQEYISEFKDFVSDKYDSLEDIDNITVQTEKAVKKISKTIYKHSILEKSESDKYSPILLSLYDFFEFLRSKFYIAQEDYEEFIILCDTIYGAQDTNIDIPQSNTAIDPIIVFSKAIYYLYIHHRELFSDNSNSEPFIYTKYKKIKELLCFKNINSVVSFVENNIDKIDSSDYFLDTFINSKSATDLLKQTKHSMIEKEIVTVSKGAKDYRIGKRRYFAIDILKLKEFIAQCE